jgi:predicted transcriptional regulator
VIPMLSKLPPRERQIVDILFESGPLTSAEVGEKLPDQISGSAIRAMLKRLEDKGFVQRADSERGYLYSPTVSEVAASKSALSEIVRVFFNGSAAGAATALLGMSDKLSADDLDSLEAMIAKARTAKGAK